MTIKKRSFLIYNILLSVFIVSLFYGLHVTAHYGSSIAVNVRLSRSKASVPADGSSTNSVTAFVFLYKCADGYKFQDKASCDSHGGVVEEKPKTGVKVKFSASSGVKLSVVEGLTNDVGKITTNASSTSIGTKTITATVSDFYTGSGSTSITFTDPTPPPTAPTAPQTSNITVGNKTVTKDMSITLLEDMKLELSGKTVANGIVTLYIFSDPKTATATADGEGNWSYSLTGLEPGDHRVEAEVKDPKTNLTSPRTQLVAFTVKPKPVVAAQALPKKNFLENWWFPIAVVLALAALELWWFNRTRKHTKTKSTKARESSSDDNEEAPQSEDSAE